jgi:hypothetical protein
VLNIKMSWNPMQYIGEIHDSPAKASMRACKLNCSCCGSSISMQCSAYSYLIATLSSTHLLRVVDVHCNVLLKLGRACCASLRADAAEAATSAVLLTVAVLAAVPAAAICWQIWQGTQRHTAQRHNSRSTSCCCMWDGMVHIGVYSTVAEVLRLQVVVCGVQVVSMHRRSSCAGLNVQKHSLRIHALWQLKRNLTG